MVLDRFETPVGQLASRTFVNPTVRDNKYLSCVYGVDRKICHEGH